jgi:hypothetical protein
MSILLESLRQSSDNQNGDIPGVGDSHFDDEMLSDEWLLAKLRMWRIIAALLAVALVITSIGWMYNVTLTFLGSSQVNSQLTGDANADSSVLLVKPSTDKKAESHPENKQSFGALEIKSSVDEQSPKSNSAATKQPLKQKYVPKKVALPLTTKSIADSNRSSNSNSSVVEQANNSVKISQRQANRLSSGSSDSRGAVIDYESLTKQQQNEMPELEISSYAVSSNSNKSFVVLNGAFYGQGETIAPNLVLISIEKESIVIRYFEQLIRKKYGL